jgi:hypothetical protein
LLPNKAPLLAVAARLEEVATKVPTVVAAIALVSLRPVSVISNYIRIIPSLLFITL